MAGDDGGARPGAAGWLPARRTLPALRRAAEDCRGCELYRDATQVVFSAGARTASLILVGEQPGDREDIEGEPFVGPAGRLLADAVDAAGVDREQLYVTNAVKHFRFEERGKRRIHRTPETAHIVACRPWLSAELALMPDAVVVCLGAVAGRAVLGRPVRIGAERGTTIDHDGRPVVITTHPSAVVRLHGEPGYPAAFDELVRDLRVATVAASRHTGAGRRPGS